jgi:hypothetical protein
MSAKTFVSVQRLTRSKKRPAQETSGPSWSQVETTVRELGEGPGGRLQLSDANEDRVMTVYGAEGAFHIGIAIGGNEFHFYTSGTPDEEDELTQVAWNQVPKDQVCRDVERTIAMVKRFFETGDRLDTVRWISEKF